MDRMTSFAGFMYSNQDKCEYCGNNEFKEANITYNLDGSVYAYSLVCKKCGEEKERVVLK